MRSLAAMLLVLPLAFAAVTVTLSVQDGKLALKSVTWEAARSQLAKNYGENIVKGKLVLGDVLETSQEGSVVEKFNTTSSVLLKNSIIKRGQAKVIFTMVSNSKVAEISARVKGSALIALFYVRNMDINLVASINKVEESGNLTISGFVELPAPQITVKNLLKVMIPKLKKQISNMGLELVSIDYEVSGRRLPPISKATFKVIVKGTKNKILEALNGLGVPTSNLIQFINLNDTATRKVDGEADLNANLKRVNGQLLTSFSVKAKAVGSYLNTTAYLEVRNRLKPVLEKLNATQLLDYLVKTDRFSVVMSISVDNKVVSKATFSGIYLKNVKGLWELLKKLESENGIVFKVLCNGKAMTLAEAENACTS